ncbi:MAG: hypothetical protein M1419_04750 [Bacteroidetes bacterium]|nr:hypothetical protein [Bacteroidota bacterium]
MNNTYRCGFCGCPTDKDGHPVDFNGTDEELNIAELVQGYCCLEQERDEYVRITMDMAIDAGDRSLVGQLIKWELMP